MPDTCTDLLAKAHRYLATHTAAWPADHLRAVLWTPEARAMVQGIDTAALAGDVRACASACRAYWKHVLAQAPAETPAQSGPGQLKRSPLDVLRQYPGSAAREQAAVLAWQNETTTPTPEKEILHDTTTML